MDLNSTPSPYPIRQIYDIDHGDRQINLIPFGSSSSSSFFGSMYDHTTIYDHYLINRGLSRQEHYPSDPYGDFKLSLGMKKFEDQDQERLVLENEEISSTTSNPRMIRRIKNNTPAPNDCASIKVVRSGYNKFEDQKLRRRRSYSPPYSSEFFETSKESPTHDEDDHMVMMMSQVRVCTDCKTTKTPLWRSGPKGPKSLCNACGIRQRKARKAMAAAADANEISFSSAKQTKPTKARIHRKEKAAKCNYKKGAYSSHLKERFEPTSDGPSTSTTPIDNSHKKVGQVEDFLTNLSNNLALHRVFFSDAEKDAAILLMAISSGLVHG